MLFQLKHSLGLAPCRGLKYALQHRQLGIEAKGLSFYMSPFFSYWPWAASRLVGGINYEASLGRGSCQSKSILQDGGQLLRWYSQHLGDGCTSSGKKGEDRALTPSAKPTSRSRALLPVALLMHMMPFPHFVREKFEI